MDWFLNDRDLVMKELNISFKYNSNEKLLLIAISPKGFFTIYFRIFKYPKDR